VHTLIIDSGGTKSGWIFLGNEGQKTAGTAPGIHPFFLTEIELSEQFHKISQVLPSSRVQHIFHYGTGTNSQENCARLLRAYQRIFPLATVEIQSDLLAVARALCGREKGIAIIMGTGSHAGLYDGEKFIKTAGGLGYALGDEGSGAYLGKHLLNHYLNGLVPAELSQKLLLEYKLSRESIVESVYRKAFPNRYLASFAPFMAQHLHFPFIRDLVQKAFRSFFQMNIIPLQQEELLPLYFIGSIGYHFGEPLREVADEFEMSIGKIAKDPIEGLAVYHA
jgi:N-acetylglucosamine kinase-like BadF-type ATPase